MDNPSLKVAKFREGIDGGTVFGQGLIVQHEAS
jgi:hypothetical protein